MKKLINKAINWLDEKVGKWPRFILSHTIVGGIITAATYGISVALGPFWAGIFAGTAVLIFKEFGELVGKEKERGKFVNDLDGNLYSLIDSVDDLQSLSQSVGAMVILLVVVGLVKAVF